VTLQRAPTVAWLLATAAGLAACHRAPEAPPLFELLPPAQTGVTFANRLPDDTAFDILTYPYYYDGGGVAVGDINNDGLPDLYFTSNAGSNRLYLNKGNYRFEDITTRAGVADSAGWKTGVTMADVNGDGYVDLYVSGVDFLTMHGHNVLYINNGDGTFTDRTKEYGLDFDGYSTQAAFFDYDGDGDLDMYLLNHNAQVARRADMRPRREPRDPKAGDRLYRNNGGHFVDVSRQAGIYGGAGGYGLGVVVSDVNFDGCPDLYVTNDFDEDDFLYRNNCDGTFTESGAAALRHTSHASMGVDAADVNNDGRPDLAVLDMWPAQEQILKTSANADAWDVAVLKQEAGYRPQFAHNTLQLNRGMGRFSEIGYLAGIYATDWSWAPLFADLDNDGRKDLFVTTGIYRRPNDLDYLAFVSRPDIQASLRGGFGGLGRTLIGKMPQVPEPNYAFHNNGDLTFTNMAAAWGLAQAGFSNGAAYVDLNNSGALDLVVNNLDAPAAIYRNGAREGNGNSYLTVELRGAGGNTAGIGTKVIVAYGDTRQLLEQSPTRGFESSVDPRLHFGLGHVQQIDSLTVIWPDRRFQMLTDVAVNRVLTLSQTDAAGRYDYEGQERQRGRNNPGGRRSAPPAPSAPRATPLFTNVTSALHIGYAHNENRFFDYHREPLIPHLLSAEGPALAVGDVNGDGLDDIYAGGAKWQPGRLYLQQRDGTFRASPQPALQADSLDEDVDAVFLDANGDGHPDLYVVSGGNEFWGDAPALQDRLYVNDGHGHLRRDTLALPDMFDNGCCVAVGDFNGDGHPDLFVGRRDVPRRYGLIPRSYLLENDGTGHFRDVTRTLASGLAAAGMVTSAAWVDYDHDGRLDLIVAGEWMPVRVFHQENGRFVDRTAEAGLAGTEGWWNSITVADVNGDGVADLVLGNLGHNSYLTASPAEPARLYLGDFAHDGTLEQILTFYKHGVSYPLAGRDELLAVIPSLRDRYRSYADYGASRIEDILPRSDLRQATVREARTFASAVALNDGHGTFTLHALPIEAQFAPIRAVLAGDVDGDGRLDLVVAGNDYGMAPELGRDDASYGLLLSGAGGGGFKAVDMARSQLVIDGQVRHMVWLRWANGGRVIVVARNDDSLQIVRPLRAGATR
jgi:enediyne biosynthesis protein E4